MCYARRGEAMRSTVSVCIFTPSVGNRKALPPYAPPVGAGVQLSLDLKVLLISTTVGITEDLGNSGNAHIA